MSALDFLIFTISVIGILLEMWQRPLFWFAYIIAAVLLVYQFWHQQLLGSSLLQICYIAMALFGWYKWLKTDPNESVSICFTAKLQWRNYFLTTIILSFVLYNIFIYYSAASPIMDAVLTSMSLVATYMTIYKHIASWFVFAATVLISVPLYFNHGLYFTALTFMIFGILDVIGGFKWRSDYRLAQTQTE